VNQAQSCLLTISLTKLQKGYYQLQHSVAAQMPEPSLIRTAKAEGKSNQILIVICLFYVINFGYVDFPLWIKLSMCFTTKVVVNWMVV